MPPFRNLRNVMFGRGDRITGDPERDLLIAALTAYEAREGERRGWDKEPTLVVMHLMDANATAVKIGLVSDRSWKVGHPNPADDLTLTASMHPPPPPVAARPAMRFADSPDGAAAVAFMSECWAVDWDELTAEEKRRNKAGERLAEGHPARKEVRVIAAVDINGNTYQLGRVRGRDVGPVELGAPVEDPDHQVRVMSALSRLVWAARTTGWPTR